MLLCGIVQVVHEECESLYKKQVRPFWDSRKLSFHFTILILKIYLRDIKLFCFCFVFFFACVSRASNQTESKTLAKHKLKGDVTQMNQLQRKAKGDSLLGFNK